MARAAVFTAADGLQEAFPVDWLIEHNAMLVRDVNGKSLSETFSAANQLWIEGCGAKHFIRDVVDIAFCDIDGVEEPSFEPSGSQYVNRPNVSAKLGDGAGASCLVERPLKIAGWADDYDRSIVAVEFSMDNGATWTRFETPEATSGRVTYWEIDITPHETGAHVVLVRSINEDGKASPVPARVYFRAYAA
jgi:hypothetical protein